MRRIRIIAAAVTVAALAMPASAFASPPGVISVSGHQEVDLGGDCPDIGAVATFVMTDGGPANSTATIVWYIYKTLFTYGNVGYGATLSFVLLIVILLLTLALMRLLRGRKVS